MAAPAAAVFSTARDAALREGSVGSPSSTLIALQTAVSQLAELFQWKAGVPPALAGWPEADCRLVARDVGRVVALAGLLAARCGFDGGPAAGSAQGIRNTPPREPTAPATYRQPLRPLPPAATPPAPSHSAPYRNAHAPQTPAGPRSHLSTAATSSGADGARDAGAATSQKPHSACSGNGVPAALQQQQQQQPPRQGRPTMKRSLTVNTVLGNQGAREAADLYSPTHFAHDLFAPVCTKEAIEVEYDAPRPALPASISKRSLREPVGPLREPVGPLRLEGSGNQLTDSADLPLTATQPQDPDLQRSSPLSPRALCTSFFPMVEALRCSVFTEEEFAALDLTFCVPSPTGSGVVDLIPNGREVKVTLATKDEFVRLALEYRNRQAPAGLPPPHCGSLSSGSIPAASTSTSPQPHSRSPSQGLHSPTQGLNSPHSSNMSPVQNTSGLRPKSPGRWLTPVHSASSFRRRPSMAAVSGNASASDDEEEEGEFKGLDLLCEVADEMLQEARAREAEKQGPDGEQSDDQGSQSDDDFMAMVLKLESMKASGGLDASDLDEMGLTFVVPHGGEFTELVEGGRHIPVTMDRLDHFIKLVKARLSEMGGAADAVVG
eukprot:TRINITY_DN9874_c0_g1_i2.p1 TRINITY_DN9874_c0_g1~~TRINITY_DN9874_c0_g1_i2.p1  ORF type:complete len:637 (+),score=150.24 TRINITY_DN9874_c0_g1_i2:93-1913(+)